MAQFRGEFLYTNNREHIPSFQGPGKQEGQIQAVAFAFVLLPVVEDVVGQADLLRSGPPDLLFPAEADLLLLQKIVIQLFQSFQGIGPLSE